MRWLINAIKWWAIGLATGQIISGYAKDKTFKGKVDGAKWLNKFKVARDYLVSTNKKLIEEVDTDNVVSSIKKTAHEAQTQIKQIDTKKVVQQATQKRDDLVDMLQEKVVHLEEEVIEFEQNAKEYAEETWTEYYRQISSKFALFKKTVSKHILQWALAAEEQFGLEQKIKFLGDKLDHMKHQKK